MSVLDDDHEKNVSSKRHDDNNQSCMSVFSDVLGVDRADEDPSAQITQMLSIPNALRNGSRSACGAAQRKVT